MATAPPLRDSDTVRPLRTNLQVANFKMCEHDPICQLLCYTIVLSKYCTIRLKIFSLKTFFNVCFLYLALLSYLCEKYYKPTVWYYVLFM